MSSCLNDDDYEFDNDDDDYDDEEEYEAKEKRPSAGNVKRRAGTADCGNF